MTYIRHQISQEVLEEIEHITSALPGKVFYSEDGEALILADEDKYIISVSPPPVLLEGFNNGNPTTQSAYLITEPLENLVNLGNNGLDAGDAGDLKGWTTGWEC